MDIEANATKEQAVEPSSVSEAVSMFQQSQAAAKQTEADAAAKKEAAATKPPESAPAAEGGEAGKADKGPDLPFRLVNEKGEAAPFVFKADGKEISEADLNKVRQYAELGYHGSQRLEALNAREKLLNEQMAVIEMVDRAMKEGRLIIKEEGAKPEPEKKEDTEEDLLADPKVKELQGRVDQLEKENKDAAGRLIKESIDKAYADLKSQIEAKKAEYPAARETEVWKLLELNDEKTGKPVHNVESAVKEAHEAETQYLMEVPLPEKRTQQIIADYVASKEKAERAPVGAPAGTGPGPAAASKPAEEPKEFGSMAEAIEAYKKSQAAGAGKPQTF